MAIRRCHHQGRHTVIVLDVLQHRVLSNGVNDVSVAVQCGTMQRRIAIAIGDAGRRPGFRQRNDVQAHTGFRRVPEWCSATTVCVLRVGACTKELFHDELIVGHRPAREGSSAVRVSAGDRSSHGNEH